MAFILHELYSHGNICTFLLLTDIDCTVSAEQRDNEATSFPTEVENGPGPYIPEIILIFSAGFVVTLLVIGIVCFRCRGRNKRSTFHASSGDQMMKETINAGSEEDISDSGKRITTQYQHIEGPKNDALHGCSNDIKCEANLQPRFQQQTVAQIGGIAGNMKRTGISRGSGDISGSGSLDEEGYMILMHPLKGAIKEIEEYHEYNYPHAKSIQECDHHSRDDQNPSTDSPDIQIHHHYHQGCDSLGVGLKETNDNDYYDSGHHSATFHDDHNPSINSGDTQIYHHYHQGSDSLRFDCQEAHGADHHVYVVSDEDSRNVRAETDGYHSYYYPDAQIFTKTLDSHE